MLHGQVTRLERTVDKIVPEMRDLERAQDGNEVKAWELQLLTDRAHTGALLDRITHHVHILEMNAESYRLKQSRSRRRQPSE